MKCSIQPAWMLDFNDERVNIMKCSQNILLLFSKKNPITSSWRQYTPVLSLSAQFGTLLVVECLKRDN